jgi:uncharacterized protein YjbJ (UPF0337 family)
MGQYVHAERQGRRTRTTALSDGPTTQPKERIMNKDQVKGRIETAKGDIKEAAGKMVGNERLKAEGRAEQAAGKVQSTAGDVKNNVGNAIKNAIDR